MPFNPETAKAAGQKSKRGPSKLLDPNIKEKMEILKALRSAVWKKWHIKRDTLPKRNF